MLLLGGTKHFGYYEKGDRPWQFKKALRQMEQKLGETLDLPKSAMVLDAGCGMGDVANYLASHFRLHVTGIDILDFNIEEAKQRAKSRGLTNLLSFKKMSYDTLDFPDNSFDAVYTMETFVHAVDPDNVLKEFYRVLKPSGKLVQFEYSHDSFKKIPAKSIEIFTRINKLAAMPALMELEHGKQEIMLNEVGFKNIKKKNITQQILPMVKAFYVLAYLPHKVLSLFRQQNKYVNILSAAEYNNYAKYLNHNIYTAQK